MRDVTKFHTRVTKLVDSLNKDLPDTQQLSIHNIYLSAIDKDLYVLRLGDVVNFNELRTILFRSLDDTHKYNEIVSQIETLLLSDLNY